MGKYQIEKGCEFVVYRIMNIDNGKIYIGITTNYRKRMKEHFGHCNDNTYLHNSIRKYGKKKFTHEIIYKSKCWENLLEKEIELIKELNTKNPYGYNLTDGGEGVLGYRHTYESRKKISESNKRREFSTETIRKMSKVRKGKKLSGKHRKMVIKANKDRKYTDEDRKRISDKLKIFSIEQILEIKKMLSEKITQVIIAKKFNVSKGTICRIKTGKCYSEIQLKKRS